MPRRPWGQAFHLAVAAVLAAQAVAQATPPPPADDTTNVDPWGVLGLVIASTLMHIFAEVAGVDGGGYWPSQLVLLLGCHECAAGTMNHIVSHAQRVALPARIGPSSVSQLLGACIVTMAAIAAWWLVCVLTAACLWLWTPPAAPRPERPAAGENDASDDDAPPEEDEDNDRLTAWARARTALRWPFSTIVIIRWCTVPIFYAAASELSRSKDRSVGGTMAALAAIICVLVLLYGIVSSVWALHPVWIDYGGPGGVQFDVLPLNAINTALGYWSDVAEPAGVTVMAAGRSMVAIAICAFLLPFIAVLGGIFVGLSWNEFDATLGDASAMCAAPGVSLVAVAAVAGVVNIAALPHRHAVASYFAGARWAGAILVGVSQLGDDATRDKLELPAVGIFLAIDIVTAIIMMSCGIIERVAWRPGEYALRCTRLRRPWPEEWAATEWTGFAPRGAAQAMLALPVRNVDEPAAVMVRPQTTTDGDDGSDEAPPVRRRGDREGGAEMEPVTKPPRRRHSSRPVVPLTEGNPHREHSVVFSPISGHPAVSSTPASPLNMRGVPDPFADSYGSPTGAEEPSAHEKFSPLDDFSPVRRVDATTTGVVDETDGAVIAGPSLLLLELEDALTGGGAAPVMADDDETSMARQRSVRFDNA